MMNDKEALKTILVRIIVDLGLLIGGTVLVSLGTNAFFGIGLAMLLIYNKTRED